MAGRFEQFHIDFKILRAAKNLRKIFTGIVITYTYVLIHVRKTGENLDKNFLSTYIYTLPET